MTGTGTLLDPYIISDVNDLQDMELDLDAYYELANDIDASATVGWNGGLGFDPIGSPGTEFTGFFDGKGFTIDSLTIDRDGADEDNIGLFGITAPGAGGWIKNVNLTNCNVTGVTSVGCLIGFHEVGSQNVSNCISSGTVLGSTMVGGLIGYNGSDASGCHSSAVITGIYAAHPTWLVQEIGGLIGNNGAGTIWRCYATGNISASGDGDISEVGGCVGLHGGGDISECYSTGDVVVIAGVGVGDVASLIGGFVGESDADTITDCYSRGDVTVTSTDCNYIGGFIGLNNIVIENCYSTGLVGITGATSDIGGFCGDDAGTITDCFWDTDTSGQPASDGGTGKTTVEMTVVSTFLGVGWSFGTIWGMTPPCNDGYPCLIYVTPFCSWGSPRATKPIIDIVTLEAIRNVEMSAMGRFYVDESGNAKYESRYARNP
jgi:hypothetical protein